MLETAREYAIERLEASGDAWSVRRRHALWCRDLPESFENALEGHKQAGPAIGAELVGAAEAERIRAGALRQPDERPLFEITVRELEETLSRDAYDRQRERGFGRSREAAVQLAR